MMSKDVRLIHGDCLSVLPEIEADSIDSLVTDPPAGIAFMGREWDSFPSGKRGPCRKTGAGKPCEAHGFAKDVHWQYKPKARDQFIAFLSSVMSECLRVLKPGAYGLVWALPRTSHWTATALEDAGFEIRDRVSHIFGQGFPKGKACLKPAVEDWWLVRKPAKRMTALNIDACRIGTETRLNQQKAMGENLNCLSRPSGNDSADAKGMGAYGVGAKQVSSGEYKEVTGRWPANLVLDEEAARLLDEQAGPQKSGGTPRSRRNPKTSYCYGKFNGEENPNGIGGSAGNVSRFFYCSKASRKDRGEGNNHPTVKNTKLMSWLVRLISNEGDTVLDPFMGSGSTIKACIETGRRGIGIEKDADYFAIAQRRIAEAQNATPLFPHTNDAK